MPGPTTAEELLQLVERSQVADRPAIQKAYSSWRDRAGSGDDPARFAQHLIEAGVITSFHAEQLLAGRYKGFRVGAYRILRLIGVGGMGRVYLAEHAFMKRRIALKVLPKSQNKESSAIERFQREAQAVAALNHPNIVHAYDSGQEGDVYFLAMEYVAGESVQDYVKRFGRVPWPYASDFIRQAAEGLQHASDNGLVHRDIKPGNLLVDLTGTVKLLDLGLAMFFTEPVEGDPLTLRYNENVLGTADYLAPEQAVDSHNIDIRADIYSLGGTLYYLLTGHAPFPIGTIAQKLLWHQQKDPDPVSSLVPEVPKGLDAVLRKMMAKRPQDRYPTAADVAAALAPFSKPHPQAFPADAASQYEPIAARPNARPPSKAVPPPPPRPQAKPVLPATAEGSSRALTRPIKPPSVTARLPKGVDSKPRSTTALVASVPSDSDSGLNFLRTETQAKDPTKRDLPSLETVANNPPSGTSTGSGASTWMWMFAGGASILLIGALVGFNLWNRTPEDGGRSTVTVVQKDHSANEKSKSKTGPIEVGVTYVRAEIGSDGPQSLADALGMNRKDRKIVLTNKSSDWDLIPIIIGGGGLPLCDHVHVVGESQRVTVSTQTPEQPLILIRNTPGFVLKDLIIDGSGRGAPLLVIEGKGVDGCRFENVVFQNFQGDAVQLLGVRGTKELPISFKNCSFLGSGDKAKGIVIGSIPNDSTPSKNIQIDDCRFVGCAAGVGVQGPLESATASRNIFASGSTGVLFAPGLGVTLLNEFRLEKSTFWKLAVGIQIDESPPTGKIVVTDGLFVDVESPPVVAPPTVADRLKAAKDVLKIEGLVVNKLVPPKDPSKSAAVGPPPSLGEVEFQEIDAKKPEFLRPKRPVVVNGRPSTSQIGALAPAAP